MLETNSTPDRLINFVLQNGWRLKAWVDEKTGDLEVFVSNENGDIFPQEIWENLSPDRQTPENLKAHSIQEHKHNFKLIPNEEENR